MLQGMIYYYTFNKVCIILTRTEQLLYVEVKGSAMTGVTRKKLKSSSVFKCRIFVVLETTSRITRYFMSGTEPLYHSLMTSLEKLLASHLIIDHHIDMTIQARIQGGDV